MKTKTCKIEGCEKPAKARQFCWMHYGRVRNGIEDMQPGRLPSKERKIYNCKYRRLYGKTLLQIASELGVNPSVVRNYYKHGKLYHYLPEEIQAVLW